MAVLDPDVTIIYCASECPIPRTGVHVCTAMEHNRKSIPDPDLAAKLEITWQQRMLENPRLWNGTKFRVDRVNSNSNTLIFHLGITCYKDFLSTNWASYADKLRALGRRDGNERQYLSDAMGVGALVLTTDSKVILLRRSHHVAEAAGTWDVPGGHAEPEMIVGNRSMDEIRPDQLNEQQVIDEMFDSITREITDEVNIPAEELSDPRIIGVAANNQSMGRPSVEFLVKCALPSEEIVRLYHLGNQAEADESTNILLLDIDDVMQLQKCFIWPKLAPAAKGCFHLYQMTQQK